MHSQWLPPLPNCCMQAIRLSYSGWQPKRYVGNSLPRGVYLMQHSNAAVARPPLCSSCVVTRLQHQHIISAAVPHSACALTRFITSLVACPSNTHTQVGWADDEYVFSCMDFSLIIADLSDPAGNCSLSATGVWEAVRACACACNCTASLRMSQRWSWRARICVTNVASNRACRAVTLCT